MRICWQRRSWKLVSLILGFFVLSGFLSGVVVKAYEYNDGKKTVKLTQKNNTDITGTASLIASDGELTVELKLEGLKEGDEYPAHIHEGTCEKTGSVAVGLNTVKGEEEGTGTSTTSVSLDELEAGEDYLLQAHLPDYTPATCGNMPSVKN